MASKEPEMANGTMMQPHVVLFASPGMGHLIPMSELARSLASPCHGFTVTMITKAPTVSSSENDKVSCLASLPSSVTVTFLPSLDDHGSNNSFNVNDEVLYISKSLPGLHEAVRSLKSSSKVVALIADFLSVDAISVARQLGLPFFVFSPINLMALSFLMNGSRLDRETATEFWDMPSIQLPGWCVPIRGTDLGVAYKDRQSEAYKRSMHWSEQVLAADGVLCNTFYDMDPALTHLMREGDPNLPPVYTVGPLIRSIRDRKAKASVFDCMEWLDHQPDGSVLFVSFGSEGTSLSPEQIAELAFGLELSRQNFLWVIKTPVGSSDAALLLEGFIERNKEVGLVVHSWVPQREVLDHRSTGGFLTHCGWNSVLESIMSGVPMIAWPLRAEQGVNARFTVNGIGVALRPQVQDTSVVHRDAIAKVVKELMRGEGGRDARRKAVELKAAGGKALSEDGSSFKDIARWKKSLVL